MLVVPAYLALTILFTWPLARGFRSELSSVYAPTDPLLQIFLLGWGWHALTTHPLGVFQAPIFYPEPRTLTYMDSMIGETVVGGPISVFFGPAAGYNFVVLLSFVMSGWMLYRLARFYGVSRSGSFLAGFLFAFCPYRFSNLGMLNQLQTQFIPIALLFAARFIRTGAYRFGLAAALILTVQAYFGWYGTFHLLVALTLLAVWERGQGEQLPWKKLLSLIALVAGLVLPLMMPYWQEHRTLPEFRRTLGDSVFWSADLLNYFQFNRENVLAKALPFLGDDQGYFPGLVSLILAVVGLRSLGNIRSSLPSSPRFQWLRATKRWGPMGYFVLLGCAGFVLSLGPVLQIAGRWMWIPLPFAVCFFVIPGFSSMRAPGRFAVLVALSVAVLAGMGFDTLRRRHPGRAPLLFTGFLLGGMALTWCPKIPFVPAPDRPSMPPVYEWLAGEPGSDPVLELPMPRKERDENATHARRQFWVLYHRKPRLDGVSGFVSNAYEEFRGQMADFPAPPTIQLARNRGARTLIVHFADYPPKDREHIRDELSNSPEVKETASFGTDVVYKIQSGS